MTAGMSKDATGVSLKPAGFDCNHNFLRCLNNGKPTLYRDFWHQMVCKLFLSDGFIVDFGVEYDCLASSRDALKSYRKVDVLPWHLALKVSKDHKQEVPNCVEHDCLHKFYERVLPKYLMTTGYISWHLYWPVLVFGASGAGHAIHGGCCLCRFDRCVV